MAISRKSSRKTYKKSRKSSKKRVSRKTSPRKSRRSSKRKSRRGSYRKVKATTSVCSPLKRGKCASNPNCKYVKRRGCFLKSGVRGGGVYEGPMMA